MYHEGQVNHKKWQYSCNYFFLVTKLCNCSCTCYLYVYEYNLISNWSWSWVYIKRLEKLWLGVYALAFSQKLSLSCGKGASRGKQHYGIGMGHL